MRKYYARLYLGNLLTNKMSYFSDIAEKALIKEIKRYRDGPCPFKVANIIYNDGVLTNEPAIQITTNDTNLYVFYKYEESRVQIRALLDAMETGPEGVYVWELIESRLEQPFITMRGYKPEKWGKWVEIRGRRRRDKPFLVLPWCYELREALETALRV